MNLFGRLPAVPCVEQPPQAVDGGGEQTEHDDDLQIQAVEEILNFGDGEEQSVLVDVLPRHEVDHADRLTRQFQFHRADDVALLDGGGGIVGQVEVFLGDGPIARRGEQGHHVVVRIELQGVGVGGVPDGDLRQRLIGVEGGLDGEAVEHPVDELGRLVEGGTTVGIAVIVAGVRALHDAEDVGRTVLVGPRDVALVPVVVLVGHDVAHAALHGAAVELAAAGLVQRHVLAQQHKAFGVFFLGGHREGRGAGNFLEGVKAHQVAQDQIHVHGGGHIAAVQTTGIGPGAVRRADALGKGVHLTDPPGEVPARKLIR